MSTSHRAHNDRNNCQRPFRQKSQSKMQVNIVFERLLTNYSPSDTIGDLKKLVSVQIGTHPDLLVFKKW